MPKKGQFYYAVRNGRNRGVFLSWPECESQVKGYPRPSFKKFSTEEEAWAFVNSDPLGEVTLGHYFDQPQDLGSEKSRKLSIAADVNDPDDMLHVYTDGACSNNGGHTGSPRAAIGVYWGPNHPMNISERLAGRQTNNCAEIHWMDGWIKRGWKLSDGQAVKNKEDFLELLKAAEGLRVKWAATRALYQVREQGGRNVTVHTDSDFLVKSTTQWMGNWQQNGWKTSTGETVKNKADFQDLQRASEGLNVTWIFACSSGSRGPSPAPASESASFCDEDTLTAFERKVSLFEAGESGGRDQDEDPREPSGDSAAGYRLLDVSCVRSLVEALLCPTCRAGGLQLRETGVGARLTFAVECSTCGVVVSAPLSSTVDGTQQTELAARLRIVSRNCGIGFTKLTNFFSGLNAPPPMHLKTYQKIATKVHDAATRAASNVMKEAARMPSSAKPHRPAFSKEVAKEVVPLYNRLAQKELLARCARMKTQNANESFNALVCKRCPKTEFASHQTIETAVALAVLDFNMGPKGMERALLEMEMEAGSHHESQTRKMTQHRLARSRASALDSSKVAYKRRKLEAVAVEQKRLNEEGPTYAPGQF
ncbi:hypothetical protein HPB47_005103 [Ixodes persulcatus]|uniref:Uncharacterized protein n=1 Tax=Ixodes persulcatus TaxID=34615 RepID=A0AC60PF41_IXOPE|nr:hypothetical protein HPB47_005103 [Ixodes persulcatus]